MGSVASSWRQGRWLSLVIVCVELQMFSHVHVGFLWVLQFTSTSQGLASRWTGCAKVPLDVNEGVCVCVHGIPVTD